MRKLEVKGLILFFEGEQSSKNPIPQISLDCENNEHLIEFIAFPIN